MIFQRNFTKFYTESWRPRKQTLKTEITDKRKYDWNYRKIVIQPQFETNNKLPHKVEKFLSREKTIEVKINQKRWCRKPQTIKIHEFIRSFRYFYLFTTIMPSLLPPPHYKTTIVLNQNVGPHTITFALSLQMVNEQSNGTLTQKSL